MKLGLCGMTEKIEGAAENGFSFLEISMTKSRELDRAGLTDLRKKAEDAGLTIDSAVQFFPPAVRLYGALEEQAALEYAKKNFEIAELLGCPFCVIGSGKARAVPEGMPKEEAEEKFAAVLGKLGDISEGFGIALAVEPLRYRETDLVNTLADGIRVKRMADRKNVGCMVDLFHFHENGEDLSEMDALLPGELRHVHLARPNPDRCAPRMEDVPVIAGWADKLRAIGYSGTVSIEGKWDPDFESRVAEAARAMAVFKD
ncbi:MAG: sugar phosphate isomerase/epimerase [Clostridia bacterium]|nr:sugar phosphate isomerase/epimerase [Clostridia bacterium]